MSANSQGFVATWLDSNDSNAYASFYAGPVMPPSNAQGCKSQNIFLSQAELLNVITWDAPTSGTPPVSYKIYRDVDLTQLVAIVPTTGSLKYIDHNRQANVTYMYYLVSVDVQGNVSTSVEVVVNTACPTT